MLLKRQITLFCSVETLPQTCTMYDIRQENSKVVHNSDQLPSDHCKLHDDLQETTASRSFSDEQH